MCSRIWLSCTQPDSSLIMHAAADTPMTTLTWTAPDVYHRLRREADRSSWWCMESSLSYQNVPKQPDGRILERCGRLVPTNWLLDDLQSQAHTGWLHAPAIVHG
jgi:hypothetical protein